MRNPRSEARRWLVQAEDDLRFAMLGREAGDRSAGGVESWGGEQ